MTDAPDRGEIHLGDLARALADLPWRGQDQAAAIAACLGFGLGAGPTLAPPPAPHRVYDRPSAPIRPQPPEAAPRKPPVFLPPTPPRPVPLPEGTIPAVLSPLPDLAPPQQGRPDWLAAGAAAFPPPPEPRLARATLLPERTARHVLAAALAMPRPGGAVHLPRLIAAVARRAPLRALPRRLEASLDRGCQLLLDYSDPMVPFWEDLNDLADQVRDLAGAEATRVYSFNTRPTEARCWSPAGEPIPWAPDDRPVLVATGLGIQGRAPAEPSPDWAEFAAVCARAGSPLLVLVPWPQDRWPPVFPANATLFPWGPRTSAGMVRRQAASKGGRS